MPQSGMPVTSGRGAGYDAVRPLIPLQRFNGEKQAGR